MTETATPHRLKSSLKLAAALGAGASMAFFGTMALQGETAKPLSSMIQRDASPPDREGPLGGYADIVERVAPSVVSIATSTKVATAAASQDPYADELRRFFGIPDRRLPQGAIPRREGMGSGVILTSDGYLVTNNHVIDGATEIKVSLPNDKKTYDAEVVGADPKTDLAVLKIDATDLPTISVADSSVMKVGDTVLAIGNPFGLSQTVTSGIVSALGRSNMSIVDYENFIQTNASINPGNSGGALVDNKGRLVGINTAILSRTGGNVGIGFAIPINMVVNIVDQLITTGEIQRGYLGVMLGDLTPDLAEAMDVKDDGVLVNTVLDNTPAKEAGLEDGDIIVRVDNQPAKDMQKTRLYVSSKRPGSKLDLTVLRDGKETPIAVTIGRLPEEGQLAQNGFPSRNTTPSNGPEPFIEGLKVDDLKERYRQQLNAEEIEGIVITEVAPDSEAATKGLKAGDIITEVGRTKVASLKDARAAKEDLRGDLLLLRVWRDSVARYVALHVG